MGSSAENEELEDKFQCLNLCDTEDKLKVVFGDGELVCDKNLLISTCKYFEAFAKFDKTTNSDLLKLKGGISLEACRSIFSFLQNGTLSIDINSFQDILEGTLFLQCKSAEEEAVAFISTQLGKDNVFRIHSFALSFGSQHLANTSKLLLENIFSVILARFSPTATVEPFLSADLKQMEKFLLSDVQTGEDLILYSVLGWLWHEEARQAQAAKVLLPLLNLHLLGLDTLSSLREEEEELALIFPGIGDLLRECWNFKQLRIDRQIDFWNRKDIVRARRWPKIVVAAGTGSSQGCLHCLDLRSGCPAWRSLAKKPASLKKQTTGSCLLYHHPKLYFLGGEQNWDLDWYNLEENKWGRCCGIAPGRLLAGGAVLGGALYLVGGVNFEQWSGSRGAAGQVVTSPSVDRYCLEREAWEQVSSLEEGRSSPRVVAVRGKLLVFGGLKQRHILKSCCSYNPLKNCWSNLKDLPEPLAYFNCLVEEREEGRGPLVWLIGGMGQDYLCKATSYVFDTDLETWSNGPPLNQARKAAFSFIFNGKIFICGGSADGLKSLNTTEVLDENRCSWRLETLGRKNWNSTVLSVTTFQPIRLLSQK